MAAADDSGENVVWPIMDDGVKQQQSARNGGADEAVFKEKEGEIFAC